MFKTIFNNINRIKILWQIFGSFRYMALIVLCLILVSSIVEGFGFAFILPLLEIITGSIDHRSELLSSLLIDKIYVLVPEHYLLLALLLSFLFILILKNIFTLIKVYYIQKFSMNFNGALDIKN